MCRISYLYYYSYVAKHKRLFHNQKKHTVNKSFSLKGDSYFKLPLMQIPQKGFCASVCGLIVWCDLGNKHKRTQNMNILLTFGYVTVQWDGCV